MVPDRNRPIPLKIILPSVLNELLIGGIPKHCIKILIGLGMHRPMIKKEIFASLGNEIVSQYKVINHAWWDESQIINIGTTCNNTPIEINRLVYDSEVKIAIGSVKPHRTAGWSGGAKMIQPGVSGFKTSGATHWLAAHYPVAEILGKENNPVRKEIEEIAKIVGLDFIVNCVVNRDYNLVEVFAGSYIEAHSACISVAKPYYTLKINELADILITGPVHMQAICGQMVLGQIGQNYCLRKEGQLYF